MIYEFRTYRIALAACPVERIFGGQANGFIHKVRSEALQSGIWPPPGGELIVTRST